MHLTLQLVLCGEDGDLVNDVWTKPRRPSRVGPELNGRAPTRWKCHLKRARARSRRSLRLCVGVILKKRNHRQEDKEKGHALRSSCANS